MGIAERMAGRWWNCVCVCGKMNDIEQFNDRVSNDLWEKYICQNKN